MEPCRKCKKKSVEEWNYCPFCAVRLREKRTPTPPQLDRDVLFLQDLYSFGWYNHHVAATVNYNGMANPLRYYPKKPSEIEIQFVESARLQQILRTKIFAEFMALLEAFGVLCLSIRDRKRKSILWSFLNTEPRDVANFFHNVSSSKKPLSLTKLLKLPTRSAINKAVSSSPKSPLAEVEIMDLNNHYSYVSDNIQLLANMYCDNNYANIRIYNKIKHIFSIIGGRGWVTPPIDSECVAILIDDKGLANMLPMSQGRINTEINNIRNVTLIGAELMALCLELHKLDLFR